MTPEQWAALSPQQRDEHVAQYGPPPPGYSDPTTATRVQPAYDAPPAKRSRKVLWIAGGVVALLVVIGIANSGQGRNPAPVAAATSATAVPTSTPATFAAPSALPSPSAAPVAPPAPVDPPAPAAPAGPATTFGNGQWAVPDDVVAGTYRSAGPLDSDIPLCYADTTPAAGGNIDQQEVSNGGPVRIRVKKGQVVKVSGCQDFTKVG